MLYISYDGILDPVGQSQVIPYLCGLAKKGIDIFVISFEKIARIRKKTSFYSNDVLLANEGIHWSPLIYHKNPATPATLFDILRGILKGWMLVKKNKITVIHARGYISGLIAYCLKLLNNVNFIFDMRGFWPEEKVDAGAWTKKGFLYRLIKYLEKKMIFKADEIIVLTEAAKNLLVRQFELKNISVIPCCVNLKTFSIGSSVPLDSALPQNRLLITYLGSTGTFYNFEEMAKFFKFFKRKNPEAYFLVLSNTDKKYILETLNNLKIEPCDYFISSVSHEKVPLFLNHSVFSLIFYNRILSAVGCCPIKFAESLACGVPIIISAGIGDCDRIVSQERIGIILKGQSPEFYEQAVYEAGHILGNKNEIRERCRNAAKKYFSLQGGINKYFNIYSRLNND